MSTYNFDNTFANDLLSNMYLKSDFADVKFTFPNDDQFEEVPAHKAILATASPVFRAMFYGSLKEADVVEIVDSSAEVFKDFLKVVYQPKIALKLENISEVVRVADKYDLMDCFKVYGDYIQGHLTNENLVMTYQLAVLLGNAKFCETRIRVFIKDVLKSKEFLQCSREMIESILRLDGLQCDEIDLFKGAIEWAKSWCQKDGLNTNNSDGLRHQLGNCFSLIRFGAMDRVDIERILRNLVHKNLFTHDELIDLMQLKDDPGYESKCFETAPRSKHLDVNESTQLICQREISTRAEPVYLKRKDSTWFSTNQPVLLSRINFCSIAYTNFLTASHWLASNIEIIEYNTNSHPAYFRNESKEIRNSIQLVYVGRDKDWILESPIIINPELIYEVRVNILEDTSNFCHVSDFAYKVKLNEKTEIQFYQRSWDEKKTREGLVSSLTFHSL